MRRKIRKILDAIGRVIKYGLLKTPKSDRSIDLFVTTPGGLPCKWSPLDEDCPGAYETSCGEAWEFSDGGIEDNSKTKFCPFCGGQIEEEKRLYKNNSND